MTGMVETVGTLVFGVIVVGLLSALVLSIGWYLFRIAVFGFVLGCIVFYIGGILMIIIEFEQYTRDLFHGESEAVWLTVYIVVCSLGLAFLLFRKFQEDALLSHYSRSYRDNHQENHQQQTNSYLQDRYLRDLELLGLERTASHSDIKQSYRSLCKKYHPDVNSDPHAAIIFKQIQKAYQHLVNG